MKYSCTKLKNIKNSYKINMRHISKLQETIFAYHNLFFLPFRHLYDSVLFTSIKWSFEEHKVTIKLLYAKLTILLFQNSQFKY